MSILYCTHCAKNINTDTDAEHFDSEEYECVEEEEAKAYKGKIPYSLITGKDKDKGVWVDGTISAHKLKN
jgi:hypothetical protein